jgi:hypothetical protein
MNLVKNFRVSKKKTKKENEGKESKEKEKTIKEPAECLALFVFFFN